MEYIMMYVPSTSSGKVVSKLGGQQFCMENMGLGVSKLAS